MSSIIYAGVKYKQVRNAIYCKLCKDTIESKSVHDFKTCSCHALSIDGGIHPGNTIVGNRADAEPRSMFCASMNGRTIWLPQTVIEQDWSKHK
jgi:hypothetical protein